MPVVQVPSEGAAFDRDLRVSEPIQQVSIVTEYPPNAGLDVGVVLI